MLDDMSSQLLFPSVPVAFRLESDVPSSLGSDSIARTSSPSETMQSTPYGKQVPFEGWLLERFCEDHGAYPLANRSGPEGLERWYPS